MRNPEAAGFSDNLPDGHVREDRQVTASTDIGLAPVDAGHDITLALAQQTLSDSETFLSGDLRQQIDKNHSNFRSKHPEGSKYHTAAYAHRSRIFKPATRSAGQRAEAAFSAAFFSTMSATSITAEDEDDPEMAAGARIWHEALEYRLRESIRWKQTAIGALQNAWVEGICITAQSWDYRVDVDGDITHDKPDVRLIPLAKFRFSSHADWRDIAGTSDYLIEEMNPTVRQVLEDMRPGPNGEPPRWLPMPAKEVAASCGAIKKSQNGGAETETVLLHMEARVFRFIVRRGGVDWTFYTLGESHMLTAPTKLKEIMPHGMRGIAIGAVTIESHRLVPQSKVELGEGLQAEINAVTNDRRDNVALAMNKRYVVKRNSGVDMASVLRNVPGGAILTREMDAVREIQTSDVTASSYKDEEYTRSSYDEIMGSFSQTSMNTNSNIGRTATGMELIASDSNIMTEYAMEVIATTWMEQALRDILMLMQYYENRPGEAGDWSVLGRAAKDAQAVANVGDAVLIPPDVLNAPALLRIAVGNDATNPQKKVLKMREFVSMMIELGQPVDNVEVAKEVAGAMGYSDGERFLLSPEEQQPQGDPAAEAAAQAEAQRAEIEGGKLQVAQAKAEQDGQIAMQRLQLDAQKAQQVYEMAVQRAELDLQREQLKARLAEMGIQSAEEIALMQDGTTRDIAGLNAETEMQHAILQGQVTQAIAARRDDTDRAKAAESSAVAREGFLSRQPTQQAEPA